LIESKVNVANFVCILFTFENSKLIVVDVEISASSSCDANEAIKNDTTKLNDRVVVYFTRHDLSALNELVLELMRVVIVEYFKIGEIKLVVRSFERNDQMFLLLSKIVMEDTMYLAARLNRQDTKIHDLELFGLTWFEVEYVREDLDLSITRDVEVMVIVRNELI
jgi:hypothetical protein